MATTTRAVLVQPQRYNLIPARVQLPPPTTPIDRVRRSPQAASEILAIRALKGVGRGRALVILGNGPTLGLVDLGALRELPHTDLMSVNRPDERVWPTRYWAFCDASQYKRHLGLIRDYRGTFINTRSVPAIPGHQIRIRNLPGTGFSRDLERGFHIGRSTVYANLQTAAWMQYERIYVLGIDMHPDGLDGKLWYYGVNPDVKLENRGPRFKDEAKHYDWAADNALSGPERARYWFCSGVNPWGFVNKYNRLDHAAAIDHIRQFDLELATRN